LCCDGTLFAWVRLETIELAWAQRLRLPLIEKDGNQAFVQPCACFDGARCSEYADRPTRCGNYRCKLLKRVESGETPLEEAFIEVETAKGLARAAYPNGRDAEAPPGRAHDAAWNLQADELEAFLDGHFQERD
jgi:hypothetical protein